jgi:hypothetical protein
MAIPASVIFYTNWGLGSLVSETYTQATPEVPNSHTWTFKGSIAAVAGSPWNGQYLADFSASWSDGAQTTVSSATAQATYGRLLVEVAAFPTNGRRIFSLETINSNERLRISRNDSANLFLMFEHGESKYAELDMGAFPTLPAAIEVIYDSNNATAANRLQCRTFAIGGTPGAFSTATGTSGSASTTSQFISVGLAEMGNADTSSKFGRVIVSNSMTEDLSQVTEAAAVAALPRRALDGPLYGSLRGSIQ